MAIQTSIKSILQLCTIILIWGSSFTVAKIVLEDVPPVTFAFLRHVVAFPLLLLLGMHRKEPPQFLKNNWRFLTLAAFLGILVYYLVFNIGIRYTTASGAAMIQGFVPAAVLLLAVIFLKEKITGLQIVGIVLSVVGVVVMAAGAKPTEMAAEPLLGNLLIVASVFAWAGYTVLSKKMAGIDTIALTKYVTLIGLLLLLPATVIELWDKPLPVISTASWVGIIYLGAASSGLSLYWYNVVLKKLDASVVGSFLNLDPVVGAIVAIVFLDEPVVALQIGGGVLVFVGVWLNMGLKKKPRG